MPTDAARVGLLRDRRFQQHETTSTHPERPARLAAIETLLDGAGLSARCIPIEAEMAPQEALRRVHEPSLLEALARADGEAQQRTVFLDPDTVMTAHSYAAARLAAGGVLRATELVARGELDSALCLPRPPGHHATSKRAMGFCLLNNVAVGAAHVLATGLAERVAIVDFDVHHGNGTQDIFYADPTLLYISTHQFPFYPGSGRAEESGRADGAGTTLNMPLPAGCGDAEYLRCLDDVILPVLRRFAPSIILVSAGFDAHWRDPLAAERLSGAGYRAIAERLRGVTAELAAGVVYVLEGGYDLEALAWSVRHCLDVLLGEPAAEDPVGPAPPLSGPAPDIEPVLAATRRIHGL